MSGPSLPVHPRHCRRASHVAESRRAVPIVAVLVSYHEHDNDFVFNWMVPRLEEKGVLVLTFEDDARPGANILSERERLIRDSEQMLAIVSPEYLSGRWTSFDADLTQHLDPAARARKLIPIVLHDAELPPRLEQLKSLDFRNPVQWDVGMAKLVDAIHQRSWESDSISNNSHVNSEKLMDGNQRLFQLEKDVSALKNQVEYPIALQMKRVEEDLAEFRDDFRRFRKHVYYQWVVIGTIILSLTIYITVVISKGA